MKKLLFIFLCFSTYFYLKGQELNCKITIQMNNIQTSDPSLFDDMKKNMEEFMNKTKWTSDEFLDKEKINCNLLINIKPSSSDVSNGKYGATVQIISSRPVYGSGYETIVLNTSDQDWNFEYLRSQPIIFSDNVFQSNLSSLLAFYAYLIIGFDYDTFQKMGGDPYFTKANNIVLLAQNNGYDGWEQFNNPRNRYWVIENILNNQFKPLRETYYEYHRNGMDVFIQNQDEARKVIFESIKKVDKVNKSFPRSVFIVTFMDTKVKEIVEIFVKADLGFKKDVYNILKEIDPTKNDFLQKLLK